MIRETAERTCTAIQAIHDQEALSKSEERLRITLDAAEIGTWDWDITTDSMVWNEQLYILLGLDPGEHQNKQTNKAYWLQFVHPQDMETVTQKLNAAVEKTGIYLARFRIIRANDGEIRWMRVYGRAVRPNENGFTRMAGVMYDITEDKILEQQKDEFIGIASHELRTPVTSIKMYVELIRQAMEENGNGQQAALVKKLDHQVDRLIKLISDLLDTTKIAEGRLVLQPVKFNLNELIEECMKAFQPTATKHRFIFQRGETEMITADRERIGQVLTNLISNAVKYSPEGGEVTITSERIKSGVKVSVQDTGIGIPEEMQAKIFKRFSRLGDVHQFQGIGLGLYISADIIRRHGGSISVKSEPGKGSTFYFILPDEEI
jgi:PAS domain S-box-containing protein